MTITRAIGLQRHHQQQRQRTQQQQQQQVFGLKKDGTACLRCIKNGNFCYQHVDQAPRPPSLQLSSSSSSPPSTASEQRQAFTVVVTQQQTSDGAGLDNDEVTDTDGDVTMEIVDDDDDGDDDNVHSFSSNDENTTARTTVFGITRNNTPCKICLKCNGFCKKHIHQKQERQQQQRQQQQQQQHLPAFPAVGVSDPVTVVSSTVTAATSPPSPTMANIPSSFGGFASIPTATTTETTTNASDGPNRTTIAPMTMVTTLPSPIFSFHAPVVAAAPIRVTKKRNHGAWSVNKKRNHGAWSMSPQQSKTRAKIMKRLTPWEERQVMDHLQSLLDAMTCPPPPHETCTFQEEAEEGEIVFVKDDQYGRQLQIPSMSSSTSDAYAASAFSPAPAVAPAPAPASAMDLDLNVLPKLPAGFKWTTMADEFRRREVRQMIREGGNTMYELANGDDEDVLKYWKMWHFPENPYSTTFNGNDTDGLIRENVHHQDRQDQQQQQHDHDDHDGEQVGSESGGDDSNDNDNDQLSAGTASSNWTATTFDELSLSTISSDDEHEDDDHSEGEEEDDDDDNNSFISTCSYDPRIEETLTRLRQFFGNALSVYMAGLTIYSGAMAVQSIALSVAGQLVMCVVVAFMMMWNVRDTTDMDTRDMRRTNDDSRFIQWFIMLTGLVKLMKLFGIITEEEETPLDGASARTASDDDDDDVQEVPTIIA